MSSLDDDNSADPERYEALINGQLHRDICVPSYRDVTISAQGSTGCLALNCVTASASFDLSTQLATLSPLALPMLCREVDQSTTTKVDSSHNVFSLGTLSSYLVHNWGLDLHGNIPSEVVRDALVMSSLSIGPSLELMAKSNDLMAKSNDLHNIFDWHSL